MRILIVSEMSAPYTVGGGEVRYELLARELVRRGHDVTWLSMRQRTSSDLEVINGVRHLHKGPRIKSPPVRPILSMLHFMFTAFFHILSHRYDAVDAQTYAPLPLTWLACILSRQKMVATIHDVSRSHDGQWMINRFHWLIGFVETLLYRFPYPRIIAVSESTANALVTRWRVNRKKIRVIPNGIELSTDEECGVVRPRNIDLIFAGRFVPTKNIEDLIEVLRICHNSGAIKRAMLVGDGPLLEAMIDRANAAGLSNIVEFPGRKSNDEVLEVLRHAKVFFHTSSREGFPVVMVEAMACGLPVVAYDVPGVMDVIENGKTGILVAERDTQAHAKACMDLLASNERRNAMMSAGKIVVATSLTVSKMADRVLNVYGER